ncbi:MAG TPA: UDP-N-acetylglucosamine--N-acetylmuramyl-(pentapeptide) pyrophosphoryl-undecaprenol N-acetylglucosamine transferase [Planctomycetota bacterium]|nr:UDP-N-acetylglucosamine--N-acetylmuramyl-(pentapeptide) pyrophosphoryl-undecaprenol N-acetylglucosamine transferase [Planctomycetota bacterium]
MIAPLHRPVVVFAGGGTGGHLYPGLAVARALHGHEPVFLIPPDRGDALRIAGEFKTAVLRAPRPDRSRLLYPVRLATAVARARRTLLDLRASAVVGLGGYASVPAALAGRTLGLPLYLMQCDAVAGRATRLLARFAQGAGLGSARARDALPQRLSCRVTGTPLRREAHARADRADFGLDPLLPTLLVLGGSQGAEGLNTRVIEGLVAAPREGFQVLHCAGSRDAQRVRAAYETTGVRGCVVDFLPEIGRAYAVADLVLARGGASTVAECAARALPAVFVPYPHHRDRQQAWNALDAVRAGAARLVEEDALGPAAFAATVLGILLDPGERAAMALASARVARPAAAGDMAAHLIETFGSALGEDRWHAELGG